MHRVLAGQPVVAFAVTSGNRLAASSAVRPPFSSELNLDTHGVMVGIYR